MKKIICDKCSADITNDALYISHPIFLDLCRKDYDELTKLREEFEQIEIEKIKNWLRGKVNDV